MIVNPTFPCGYVTFCDDIRHEITGKLTLVGVYHAQMDVVAEPPAQLMQLNVLIDFRFTRGSLSTDPVFKIFRSDVEGAIVEMTVGRPQSTETQLENVDGIEPGSVSFDQFVLPIQLSGMIIRDPCILRVRAFVGDDEYRLGSLKINLWPPNEPPESE